jgi:hypothetical protein
MTIPEPVAPVEPGAAAVAQPVDTSVTPAVQPQQPQSPSQAPSEQLPAAPADDTADWLTKKGFDPSDPEFAMKVAKSYREAEKLAMRAAEEASELKKTLAQPSQLEPGMGQDDSMQEFIQDYRRDKQINAFKESHSDWAQHEPAMVDLLSQTVNTPYGELSRSQMVNAGLLSLDDVYAIAKGNAPADTELIKTQAQQEVLQTLANTQRAGGGNAHASTINPETQKADPIIDAIRKSRGE